MISNSFTDQENLTCIFKTVISDHFQFFTVFMIYKLDFNKKSQNKKESNKCRLDSKFQRCFM